ncbi:hypothetical protein KOR42_45110 [Thalassoglobus neptunius]|uniref:Uncharacterized protein n=1 Tax=Thalassoglobus neptunius TaxID=1938619 RepID=A0A5C5VZ70_9PLAN|nr:peptidoglycan-binding domain-containing protein [Thalassoglobus neptunius]TWT43051.1 hypothetical protein KOR42_45110 [Thalassoglobus neptunius]
MADLLQTTCDFLKRYGYLSDSEDPQSFEDIGLTSAIAKFQRFDANVARLKAETGKPLHHDGVLGPATQLVMSMPRCCVRDDSGLAAAIATGGWKNCHGAVNEHRMIADVDVSNMPVFLEPHLHAVLKNVQQAYAEIGLLIIFRGADGIDMLTKARFDGRANTVISWTRGRGWIGLAIVGNGHNQTCTSEIWAQFDTRYQPTNIVREWTTLFLHELGHNCGLQHSRGGVMNPSIVNGLSGRWDGSDPSTSILKRWFGGQPVNVPGGEDDPDSYNPPDDTPSGVKPYSEPFTLANGKRVFLVEMFGQ